MSSIITTFGKSLRNFFVGSGNSSRPQKLDPDTIKLRDDIFIRMPRAEVDWVLRAIDDFSRKCPSRPLDHARHLITKTLERKNQRDEPLRCKIAEIVSKKRYTSLSELVIETMYDYDSVLKELVFLAKDGTVNLYEEEHGLITIKQRYKL